MRRRGGVAVWGATSKRYLMPMTFEHVEKPAGEKVPYLYVYRS